MSVTSLRPTITQVDNLWYCQLSTGFLGIPKAPSLELSGDSGREGACKAGVFPMRPGVVGPFSFGDVGSRAIASACVV